MSQQRKGSVVKGKDDVKVVDTKKSVAGRSDDSVAEAGKLGRDKSGEASCSVCSRTVTNEDLALECEICETWFHVSCEDVSELEYEFLTEHKSVHWYCSICNKNVAKVIKMVSNIKQSQEKLEQSVKEIRQEMTVIAGDIIQVKQSVERVDHQVKEMSAGKLPDSMMKAVEAVVSKLRNEVNLLGADVKGVKEQMTLADTRLETAIEAKLVENVVKSADLVKKELEPSWASRVASAVDSKFETVTVDVTKVQQTLVDVRMTAEEEKDRESRSHNIIIYRVPELEGRDERLKADKDFCIALCNEALDLDVQENDIKSLFRLGKRGESHRPLLIQFREKTIKNRVMESLFKLRMADDKFKNISVTHDLTRSERVECKHMVEEAKKKQQEEQGEFHWRVRGLPGQLKLVKFRKN